MVFSELESLVQMTRFAIEQAHTPYRAARICKNPPDMDTPSEPGDRTDSTPEDDEDENAVLHTQSGTPENNGDENVVSHTQGVVVTVNLGERVTTLKKAS